MARFKTLAVALVASAAALSAAACSSGSTGQGVRMSSSWAEHYTTVSDLDQHSDLVVVGEFAKVLGTTETPNQPGATYTDFQFTVSRVLHDRNHRLGGSSAKTVTIHQPGGVTAAGQRIESDDDSLFVVGERALLFLQWRDGRYMVVGGPNGRFELSGSTVSPYNAETAQYRGDIAALASTLAGQ